MDTGQNERLKLKMEKYSQGAGKSLITRQWHFSSTEAALVFFSYELQHCFCDSAPSTVSNTIDFS